jgi:tRNA(Ile)-lysidine synthase
MGPPPAVAAVRTAVRATLAQLDVARPLLVACSGGADSLALAASVAFEAPRAGRAAGAVVVDHGLQAGSAEIARSVADVLRHLGLEPVEVVAVGVGTAGGPEGAARTARYDALARIAGDAYVLLGHTRDDQAETVLLGLGRGSGPRSIAGMRRIDGRYVRPLLDVARATTEAACAALGLDVWNDPHNLDPRFRRVRLRTEALPLLEDILAGGVAEALARTAVQIRADVDALDQLAASWLDAHGGSADRPGLRPSGGPDPDRLSDPRADSTAGPGLAVALLLELPAALRTRVLRRWAHAGGAASLSAVHIAALDALCTDWHGQGPLDLPGRVCAARRSGRLHLDPSA